MTEPRSRGHRYLLWSWLALALASPLPVTGQQAPSQPRGVGNQARPIVRVAEQTGTSGPLRDLPTLPPVVDEVRVLPRKTLPNRAGGAGAFGADPVLQPPTTGVAPPPTITSFDGIDNRNGVLPPDTVVAVGPNHIVQMVNLSIAAWDTLGNLLMAPKDTKDMWKGTTGNNPCRRRNDGDPIVLYDQLADRWMVSQFALPRFPLGPFYGLYPDFPKSTNTLYLYILRAKLSVRPAQVDGIYVNIISHGSTPARTRACSDTTPRPDALYRALSRLDAVSDQAHVNVTHCQI